VGIGTASPATELDVAGQITGERFRNTGNFPTNEIGDSAGRHILGTTDDPVLVLWNEDAAAAGKGSTLWLGAKSGAGVTTIGGARFETDLDDGTTRAASLSIATHNAAGTITTALTIDSSQNVTIAGDLTVSGDNIDSAGAPLRINNIANQPTYIGSGTANVATGDNDLYVTDALEVDGEFELDGPLDADSTSNFAGVITAQSNIDLAGVLLIDSSGIRLDAGDGYFMQVNADSNDGFFFENSANTIAWHEDGVERGSFDLDQGNLQIDGLINADGTGTHDFEGSMDINVLLSSSEINNCNGACPTIDVANGAGDLFVEGDLEVDGEFELDGALDADGVVTLGDNGDNVTINSNVWDITGAGVASGLTGLTVGGNGSFAPSGVTADTAPYGVLSILSTLL